MTDNPFASFIDYNQVIDNDYVTLSPMNPGYWAYLLKNEEGCTVTDFLSHKRFNVGTTFTSSFSHQRKTVHCRNFAVRLTNEVSMDAQLYPAGECIGCLQFEHDGEALKLYFWLTRAFCNVGFERKILRIALSVYRQYFSDTELHATVAMRDNETALQLLIDIKASINEYSTMMQSGKTTIEVRDINLSHSL